MIRALSSAALLIAPLNAEGLLLAEKQGVSVYSTSAPDPPFQSIAISPRAHLITMFDGPYRPGIWNSDVGLWFEKKLEAGLVFDRSTGLSIPNNVRTVRAWKFGEQRCASALTKPNSYEITCAGRIARRYQFEIGRGVTAFDWPCRDKRCWFELKTAKGILGGL